MFDELNKVTIGDKEYPFKCDIFVLEKIQSEFGTLDQFEMQLKGWRPLMENGVQKVNDKGEPLFEVKEASMKAIRVGLYNMLKEGVEIHNQTSEEKMTVPSERDILLDVDVPLDMGPIVYAEYLNCFKKKNVTTTQKKPRAKKPVK